MYLYLYTYLFIRLYKKQVDLYVRFIYGMYHIKRNPTIKSVKINLSSVLVLFDKNHQFKITNY